jgi:6-phosphogluconolactonase
MKPDVVVAPLSSLLDRLVADVFKESQRANDERGLFAIALPGGSVGTHGFPALAAIRFDWDMTHVFWADERAVPATSPDSNFGLAEKLWLRPRNAKASSIHRMPADNANLQTAAAEYDAEISRVLGDAPRLDLALLGVGPDGHVASLFPGHAALTEDQHHVLAIADSPKPPPGRLTLTLPLLAGAERVVVMALGESKADVMRKAVRESDSSLPVSLVLKRARRPLVLLDNEAGARV